MRHAFTDTLMSIGALVLLLAVLVAIDDRVRDEITARFNRAARPAAQLYEARARARSLMAVVLDSARDQMRDHTPMMLFAFAGTALLLFMMRT